MQPQPLKFDELYVGMRVRCIDSIIYADKTATIISIRQPYDRHDRSFQIKWDEQLTGYYNKTIWVTAERFEEIDKILNKDMKCSDCNIPSPHAKTNLPDNKYICDVCKTMRDLS